MELSNLLKHLLVAAGLLTGLSCQPANDETPPSFIVVSDTHFGSTRGDGAMVKVSRALKILFSKQPSIDAIFVIGDLTDRGKPEEYDQLLAVFSDTAYVPEGTPVYFMGGYNHDRSPNKDYSIYSSKIPQPLNQYLEIKGYPFITLTEGGSNPAEENTAVNEEAKRFLSEKLDAATRKYPGKPVFVFVHEPPINTCYGSWEHEGWGTATFVSILNRYPQAIVFSGHSHYPLSDPRSIHQDQFTAVNDGGLSDGEVERGVINIGRKPENHESVQTGLLVRALPDGDVEIERWDARRDEEILPRWTIAAPHDGSRFTCKNRDGLPAPVFADGVEPQLTFIRADSCEVSFMQATDNEVVHRYLIEILDGEQVIASFSKFSQYYLNSAMPATLTVGFTGLPSGKPLTAQVTAIDSYNNRSVPIKSEPKRFQIRAKNFSPLSNSIIHILSLDE